MRNKGIEPSTHVIELDDAATLEDLAIEYVDEHKKSGSRTDRMPRTGFGHMKSPSIRKPLKKPKKTKSKRTKKMKKEEDIQVEELR